MKQQHLALNLLMALVLLVPISGFARDLEIKPDQGEISVYVAPNEPTQIQFPGEIVSGYKKKNSALSLDRQKEDLVIFANQNLSSNGEAFIVRLKDGRSYSLRILRSGDENPRDDRVNILDDKNSIIADDEEETPIHQEKQFKYAPPTMVSGLVREMVLATEFGKAAVPGYKQSDKYKGQVVLNDGTLVAKIESIFIGPNLWGYVLEAENQLDQTQKLNPASFRLDGARAVSFSNWELAPKPMTIEEQITRKDKTTVYVVTRARN